MIPRAAVLALVIGLATPAASSAQAPSGVWSGGVFYDGDYFSGSEWVDWSAVRGTIHRRIGTTTLGVELGEVRRFGERDRSVAGEAYLTLWPRASAHVRAGVTPDARLLPRSDWRAALYQGLPGG